MNGGAYPLPSSRRSFCVITVRGSSTTSSGDGEGGSHSTLLDPSRRSRWDRAAMPVIASNPFRVWPISRISVSVRIWSNLQSASKKRHGGFHKVSRGGTQPRSIEGFQIMIRILHGRLGWLTRPPKTHHFYNVLSPHLRIAARPPTRAHELTSPTFHGMLAATRQARGCWRRGGQALLPSTSVHCTSHSSFPA